MQEVRRKFFYSVMMKCGMCVSGVDVQHLTGSEELLKTRRILSRNDYLHTFTIQRFRMTVVMQKRKPHAAFLRS